MQKSLSFLKCIHSFLTFQTSILFCRTTKMEAAQHWNLHNFTNSVNINQLTFVKFILVYEHEFNIRSYNLYCKLSANRRALLEWRHRGRWTFTGYIHCCTVNLLHPLILMFRSIPIWDGAACYSWYFTNLYK